MDRLCLINSIVGYRLKLQGESTSKAVMYVQAYPKERKLAYQAKGKNEIVPLAAVEMLNDPEPDRSNSSHSWTKSSISSLGTQCSLGIGGTARFEITDPLKHLRQVNLDFSNDLLRNTLVALPKSTIRSLTVYSV